VACQHRTGPHVEINKRGLLVNLSSPTIYSYIKDRLTYEKALTVLKSVYIKKKFDVFATHLSHCMQAATRRIPPAVPPSLNACLLWPHLLSAYYNLCNFFTASFLQLPTTSETHRTYAVQCFKLVAGIIYCNYFRFYMQLLSRFSNLSSPKKTQILSLKSQIAVLRH